MNFGILEALLIPEIATEADDITKQVNDIMGGKKAPAENKSNDQRDEDLTQTDNIFDDIQKDDAENNPQNNPTDTDDQSQDKTDTSDDSQGENDNNSNLNDESNSEDDGDGSNTQDDMDTDSSIDDESGEDSESQDEKSIFSDKNTLKKNMIYFFNIIRYTITSLEDSLGNTEDQETIRVINSVIHNLYATKDVLYNILTKQIEKTPYEVLTTKYITIKRIYDISCDMLEEHFKNNPNQKVKYKRFRNKTK